MGADSSGVVKAIAVFLIVAFVLVGTGGYLVWNVVTAVRALDGKQVEITPADFNPEKIVRDILKNFGSDKKTVSAFTTGMEVKINQVRFFESDKTLPPIKERIYSNQFSTQARYITAEVNYKNNSFQVEDAANPAVIQFYNPAGQMIVERKGTLKPKKEWPYVLFSVSVSAQEAGGWQSGRYSVKIFINGAETGPYQFTIE